MPLPRALLSVLLIASPLLVDSGLGAPGNANPIVPGCFAGPAINLPAGIWEFKAFDE